MRADASEDLGFPNIVGPKRSHVAWRRFVIIATLGVMWAIGAVTTGPVRSPSVGNDLRDRIADRGGLILWDKELGQDNAHDLASEEEMPDWLRLWIRVDFREPKFEGHWRGDDLPVETVITQAAAHHTIRAISLGGHTPALSRSPLAFLRSCNNLRYLQLSGSGLYDDFGAEVSNLTHLEYLGLRKCGCSFRDIVDQTTASMAKLSELRYLSLASSKLTDAGLERLRPLGRLRYLSLASTLVSDEGLKHLQAFPELRYLSLADTTISDRGIGYLSSLQELEALNLSGTRITSAGLQYLEPLANVRKLYFTRTAISDNELGCLRRMNKLEVLGLSVTRVTDRGLADVGSLSHLRELHLSRDNVSDVGVRALVGLQEVEVLSLSYTQVTDACIKSLVKLPMLRVLGLAQHSPRQLTRAGMERLVELHRLSHLGISVEDVDLGPIKTMLGVEVGLNIREQSHPEAFFASRDAGYQ